MRNRKSPLTPLARSLRHESTDAERRLWSLLRNRTLLGCKFRRQFPIGPYIADFACAEKRLIVELDGGQHLDQVERDEQRSAYLKAQGYTVLRFWNNDMLLRKEDVLEQMLRSVAQMAAPHPDPLPASGERGRRSEPLALLSTFAEAGYSIIPAALNEHECATLRAALANLVPHRGKGGERNLLARPEVVALCRHPAIHAPVRETLGGGAAFAYKATLFDKTPHSNWKVVWHQDLSIPLRGAVRPEGWRGWAVKAGVLHGQPPADLLARLLAVRVHLDDCDGGNGALRVLPGSHRAGRLDDAAIERWKADGTPLRCDLRAGGLLLLRPLLLHASSAGEAPGRRRVLHLEFAAEELPEGLEWAERVSLP